MENEYRLRNHPLEEVGEYTMNLYIDMLCAVAGYENSNTDSAYKLIANIMLSAGMKHSIFEHIKNAMTLTVKRFSEFVTECCQNELHNIFLIDSLLIICSNGQPCKKQIEFIANIATVFGITLPNLKGMTKLTARILEQNKEYFSETWWWKDINDGISFKTIYEAMCYVKQISDVLITIDEQEKVKYDYPYSIYYESKLEQRKTDMSRYSRSREKYNKIIIENIEGDNLSFSYNEDFKELTVRRCVLNEINLNQKPWLDVKIENCIIEKQPDFDHWLIKYYNIRAINCIFKCHGRQLSISLSNNFRNCIKALFRDNAECINCKFIDCSLYDEEDEYKKEINLQNCEFIECNIWGMPDYVKIDNAIFTKCVIKLYSFGQKTIENLSRNDFQFIECQFIGANKIEDPQLRKSLSKINQINCQFID